MSGKYDARIAAGMAVLDEHMPGWERRIDLETLEMASTCRCVVGQLAADGDTPDTVLGIRSINLDPDDFEGEFWPTALGFSVETRHERATYRGLTTAWKRAIRERLAARP